MLATVATALLAAALGIAIGMRVQLARKRLGDLRRGILQMQNEGSLEAVFAASLRQRDAFEAAGWVHHVRVVNVVQFVLTWNWDLSILLDLLRAAPEAWNIKAGWRRKLLARTLALVAYETLTKLEWTFDPSNSVRKTSIWRPIRALSLEPRVGRLVIALHQDVSAVLVQHRTLLEGVRNNIIGHRDQDVATQLLWMRKADADEIESLGWDLLKLTTTALQRLGEIIAALPNGARAE